MTDERVLVIEDDPGNMELVLDRLSGFGMRAVPAMTAAEGLARVSEQVFDVVLLDLRLPDADGLEVLSQLRADYPQSPVVIMTAHGSPDLEAEAIASGAAHYLLKPFSRKALLEAIRVVAKRER